MLSQITCIALGVGSVVEYRDQNGNDGSVVVMRPRASFDTRNVVEEASLVSEIRDNAKLEKQ